MADEFGDPAQTAGAFDRYGRYLIADPHNPEGGTVPWTRVTTVASAPADMWNLQQWEKRKVIAGLAQHDDLWALARAYASTPELEDANYKPLNDLAEEAKERAKSRAGANRGTALHSYAETWEATGRNVAPAEFAPHVEAYSRLMASAGLEVVPEFTEARVLVCPTCNPETTERVAGRTDRVVRCADGRLRILDLKTEKEGREAFEYSAGKTAIQLSAYANCSHIESKTRGWIDDLRIDRKMAYVAHVPSEKSPDDAHAELFVVDIEAGWQGFRTALEVRAWRRRKRLVVPVAASRVTARPDSTEAAAREQVFSDLEASRQAAAAARVVHAGLTSNTLEVPDEVFDDALSSLTAAYEEQERARRAEAWARRLRAATVASEGSAVWQEATARGEWTTELNDLAIDARVRILGHDA